MDDQHNWTLSLPPAPHCSVGSSCNELVEEDGSSSRGRLNEDRHYTCHYRQVQLYMVLDGHDGTRACEFAQKHLPSVLLRSELEGGTEMVGRALRHAFLHTEREFFLGIDPQVTRKITLQIEIQQKARNAAEALSLFPNQVEEIQRLDNQIRGGTTAVVALFYNDYLHIANVGDSRALLCYQGADNHLHVEQLSEDHTTRNEDELRRLQGCGLDPKKLRRYKRLGIQQNTRSIGDYSIKGGYQDTDIISHATKEPGTAEPFIAMPIDLRTISSGFLVLMSDGLYEAYEACTKRPSFVNQDLGYLIAQEMRRSADITSIAQNVVESVKQLYRATCRRSGSKGRLDDITLIIRELNFFTAFHHTISYPGGMTGHLPPHTAPVLANPHSGGMTMMGHFPILAPVLANHPRPAWKRESGYVPISVAMGRYSDSAQFQRNTEGTTYQDPSRRFYLNSSSPLRRSYSSVHLDLSLHPDRSRSFHSDPSPLQLQLSDLDLHEWVPDDDAVHTPVSSQPSSIPTPTSPEQQPIKTETMLLFEEAMKQGYIEVCIIKCLLLGTAGVGKTSLLHLLLNMLPPPLRQSTACIEQAIRAICMKYGIDSGGEWQRVDSDRLRDLLAGSISKEATSIRDSVDASPANGSYDHEGATPHDHEGTTPHDREGATPQHEGTTPHDHEGATPHDHEGTTPHNHEGTTASTEPVSYTMEAIFKHLEGEPGLGKLQDMTWVYLVDSGGQPQFHELLTAFVRNALVGIFVHKLSERLDDPPYVQYFDKEGDQCGQGYPLALSNRDIFQHCIQTVQSLPYSAEQSACPQLAVVGTHRDEEDQCEGESRDDKNKQLLEILRPIRDDVFFCTGMQDVIFPVNALSPDPEDKAVASQLRHTIESLKPPPKKLPLHWYGLELELEKEALEKERLVFTRGECLQVAKRLHFPSDNIEKALDAALGHLDELNIFLYYPKVLPELLFCSPCILLDKISELVEESHRMKHGPDPNALIEGKLSQFCNKGQVTAQLLGDYPKHYTEFFTQAHLLKLFQSLLIVAPIDRDTYFMPSLLDVLKQSEFRRLSGSCPLVILFRDRCSPKYAPKYAPLGLFSSVIAFLLSDTNESSSWVIADDSPKLYRNHITLALGARPGSVTLIDSATFFEVHIVLRTSLPLVYKDTCRYVSETIERGLKQAIKTRNFQNICYEKAISCPCDEGQRTIHPALLRTLSGTRIWKCTRSDVCEELEERHLVWVEKHTDTETDGGEPSPPEEETLVAKHQRKGTTAAAVETVKLNSRPALPDLLNFQGKKRKIRIVREIGTQYTTFGVLLLDDETGAKIDAISDKHRDNAEKINFEILREWLAGRGREPVSWRTLIMVLHDAGLSVLADDIEAAC